MEWRVSERRSAAAGYDRRIEQSVCAGGHCICGRKPVPRGGHNIIEPALHGVATVVGTHTENFRDIVRLFQSRDAVRIAGPSDLPLVLMELLNNDAEQKALGQRAAETMRSQLGATARTLTELQKLLART